MCDGLTTDMASYPFPTCATHLSLVTDYPDFYSWVWESMYLPHGPVHTWIGGVLNCEDTIDRLSNLIGRENTDLLHLCQFGQRKALWQDGFFECEGSVPTDGVSEEDVRIYIYIYICMYICVPVCVSLCVCVCFFVLVLRRLKTNSMSSKKCCDWGAALALVCVPNVKWGWGYI